MKHIVLIIDSLVGGGAEQTNVRLAKMFIEHEYKVTIIVMRNVFEIHYDPKIKIICLNYKKSSYPTYFTNLYFSKKLDISLKSLGSIDLIIGSLGLTHKLMNIIDSKHNFYYALHGATTKAKLDSKKALSYYLKKKELINIYNNKNIICVSNGVKEDILTLPIIPKSIQVIYNPFDFDEIRTKANDAIDFAFPKEYIIHVGRFAKVKRHDILIKAFAQIKNKNIKLVLVGEGSEQENIIQLVKKLHLQNRVIFAGFFENPFPIIQKAKLLVLSSESEGFGNVLIEAQILQVPIVSTQTIGANEIMKCKLSDFLSPINNYIDLSEKINIALKNTSSIDLSDYKKDVILKQYNKITTKIT